MFTDHASVSRRSTLNEQLVISKSLVHVLVMICLPFASPIMGLAFKVDDRCLLSFLMLQA